jgi:CheY-like chemotaxis protein
VITQSLLAGSVSPAIHVWLGESDSASLAPGAAAAHEAVLRKIRDLALRVLVVDDDRNVRQGLRRRLENDYGAEVVDVPSGDAALQADLSQYDVLLVDVVMPGMSGVVTCEKMIELQVRGVIALMSTNQENERAATEHHVAFYDKNSQVTALEPILLRAAGGRPA